MLPYPASALMILRPSSPDVAGVIGCVPLRQSIAFCINFSRFLMRQETGVRAKPQFSTVSGEARYHE
jgi:hypothetical protein